MRILPTLSILLLAVTLSCLDKIELEVPPGLDSSIDIRGELIMGDPPEITVYLDRVFNFEISSLSVLRARLVELIDEEGNKIEVPSRQDGIHYYRFSPSTDPIKIEFGQRYKIRVALFDGQVFESEFEEMIRPVGKGKISVREGVETRVDINGDFRDVVLANFFIDAPLQIKENGTVARLQWIPQRTFKVTDSMFVPDFISKVCYITNNIDVTSIFLLDGSLIESDSVREFPLSVIPPNYEFAEGYYYTVFQRSLSEGSFEYWQQIQQTFGTDGNIFSPPVGRLTSNIKNVDDPDAATFGYFSAFAQDTIRLYVPPGRFNVVKACPRPPVPRRPCPFSVCCDCAGEVGSQTTVPDFWEE